MVTKEIQQRIGWVYNEQYIYETDFKINRFCGTGYYKFTVKSHAYQAL